MLRAALSALALFYLASGCQCREEVEETVEPAHSPTLAPLAEPRRVETDAAFALTPVSGGALLLFGEAGGGVRAQALGPFGEARGPARLVSDARRVVELDAFALSSRVGVAWVEETDDGLVVRASLSTDGGIHFRAAETLGPTVTIDGERGRLAMSPYRDDELVLYHRVEAAECVANPGHECARFRRRRLGREPSRAERGVELLEVLHPCEPLVAGALSRDGTTYHGICHVEDTRPSTTIYAIRPAISYAGASPLIGCAPLAMSPLDDGVAVLARCQDGPTIATLDELGSVVWRFPAARRTVTCRDGRPVCEMDGAVLHLGAPIDHIEALLPMVSEGARAIWTGEAILIAEIRGEHAALRRYGCGSGSTVELLD